MQGPGENAGVVEVGDGWALAFKMESHNHPSAVEPYEGAATGVGGIIRDILAMGARPVALLDSLRFGPLDEERSRYLFREVVRGIGGYGNAVGVPTVGGEVEFARAYSGNPLVNAMCVGLIRVDDLMSASATGEGNLVVLLGSKTGRDGIHGATFASDELTEESESKRSNVQVGDPFSEKMLIECCLKLLEEDLLVSLQDLGAAGITSSASEMAAKGGVGIEIETDRVPLRESGMEPWEVMISESQERMLAVVEPEKVDEVLRLAERYELVGAVVGRVAGHGDLRVIHHGEVVGTVPAEYLADAPVYERDIVRPQYLDDVQKLDAGELPEPEDYNAVLLQMLGHPNLRSRRPIFTQYDHQVGTDTVVLPGADAAVMRIKGTDLGFAVTTDGTRPPLLSRSARWRERRRSPKLTGTSRASGLSPSPLPTASISAAPRSRTATTSSPSASRGCPRLARLRNASRKRQRQPLQRDGPGRHLPDPYRRDGRHNGGREPARYASLQA